MKDKFSREINYLRISITDRCNMHCNYCMPKAVTHSPAHEILTFEEIVSVAKAAANCGISKLKITGGEPLLRPSVHELIRSLKSLRGIEQVTMTTNGVFLSEVIHELKDAGLDAVNVSLDSLNPERFKSITGCDSLAKVLEGISSALAAGIPVKINTVLQEGVNDSEVDDLLNIAKGNPVHVRFIELMPIGEGRHCRSIDNDDLRRLIASKYSGIEQDCVTHGNGPARYIRIPGFVGSVGFISALCENFCSSCNRLRLTAHGRLKHCLCFASSIDLREILRNPHYGSTTLQQELERAIIYAIDTKPEGHCFGEQGQISETAPMFRIGG